MEIEKSKARDLPDAAQVPAVEQMAFDLFI